MNSKQLENKYKQELRKRLRDRYPGCVIINYNPNQLQGVSDILILHGSTWAMLEGKRSADADIQPNQPYYVDLFNSMSFAAFIFPENEREVLIALDKWFDFVNTTLNSHLRRA
jgi:hypothetical protein